MGTCFATSPLIISKRAAESIKQSLSRYDQLGKYEKDTIRVYLKTGGWGGPGLRLALVERDSIKAGEDTVDDSCFGLRIVINKDLLQQAKPIKIYMEERYIMIDYNKDILKSLPKEGGCK